jgi:hypothetical protein
MKQVFTTIQAQLKAKVPALKTVTRWNNQLGNTDTEKLVRFPACFYQLVGIRSSTISKGIQHHQATLRLRFADAGLAVEKLQTYEVEDAAYLVLQNFSGDPLLVGLDRIGADPDDNYDACEVLVVDYAIKFQDTGKFRATYVSRQPDREILVTE